MVGPGVSPGYPGPQGRGAGGSPQVALKRVAQAEYVVGFGLVLLALITGAQGPEVWEVGWWMVVDGFNSGLYDVYSGLYDGE